MTRFVLLFVVVGLLVAGVLYDELDPASEVELATAESVLISPSVSDPPRLDGAWYCPVGSSAPGGYADHELHISNLGAEPAVAAVSILTDDGRGPALRVEMAPQSTQSVLLSTISQSEVAGAVVELIGGEGVVAHTVQTPQGPAHGPCATHVSSSWYFASGRTTRDATNVLVLMNPFPEDVVYSVEFYRSAGRPRRPADLQGGVIPANSVEVIEVESYIAREEAVATVVNTLRGRLVAERLQTLDGALGPSGAALEVGVVAPASSWMFPAGRIHGEGGDRVVVFNPSQEETAAIDIELWPLNPTDRSLYGLTSIPRELLPGRFEVIDLGIEADRFGLRLPYEVGVSVNAEGAPVVAERWHFATGVDTTLIGAGGSQVNPTDEGEASETGDTGETGEEGENPDGSEPVEGDDPEASGTDPVEADAEAEAGVDAEATDPDRDPILEGELDVPGILGGQIQELAQPTADTGAASSRGTEVLASRWVIPWLPTPSADSAAVIITAPNEASVEVMALVNGEFQGPFQATVAPFGRAIIPIALPTSGAPVVVTANTPISVEAQVVVLGQGLSVIPGLPTVRQ